MNARTVEKYVPKSAGRKCFAPVEQGQLRTGDLLRLHAGQEVPCDCLILSVCGALHRPLACCQRGGIWDDLHRPTVKRSLLRVNQRQAADAPAGKLCSLVTGTFRWEYTHAGYLTGFGTLKQGDTHTPFEFTTGNVLNRGATFAEAQSVVALALNVGHMAMGSQAETDGSRLGFGAKLRQLRVSRQRKPGLLENAYGRMLSQVQLTFVVIAMALALIAIFQSFALGNAPAHKFERSVLGREPGLLSAARQCLSLAAGLLINLPYLASPCMEVLLSVHAQLVTGDAHLVPANVEFSRAAATQTLGLVDSLVASKASVVDTSASVAACRVREVMYYNNRNTTARQALCRRKVDDDATSVDSGDDTATNVIDYLPHYVGRLECRRDQWIAGADRTEPLGLLQDRDAPHIERLLLALVLCHEARVEGPVKPDHRLAGPEATERAPKSPHPFEEAQLQFAHSMGARFLGKEGRLVTIELHGKKARYEQLRSRQLCFDGIYVAATVVKAAGGGAARPVLYVKGPYRTLAQHLATDDQNGLAEDAERLVLQGIHPIVVGKRTLEPEEAQQLLGINISSTHGSGAEITDDKVNRGSFGDEPNPDRGAGSHGDELLAACVRDLSFCGLLGFKRGVSIRNCLLLDNLRGSGVKLYLLSQDATHENRADYNALQLFRGLHPVQVAGDTEREVEASLKQGLRAVLERRRRADPPEEPERGGKPSGMTRPQGPKGGSATVSPPARGAQLGADQRWRDRDTQANAVHPMETDEQNSIFFDGEALRLILRDATLSALFVSLCGMSRVVVGSGISVYQQRDLARLLRAHGRRGDAGYVMGLVSGSADRFMLPEVDVSVGLRGPSAPPAELLARCDIQMDHLYGIGYLLLRHGTLAHRRLGVLFDELLWRTAFTFLDQAFYFVANGHTLAMPSGLIFYTAFMTAISPAQCLLEGVLATDHGYAVLHRVVGEYRQNRQYGVPGSGTVLVLLSAAFDAALCNLACVADRLGAGDFLVGPGDGKAAPPEVRVALHGLMLVLCHHFRARSTTAEALLFTLLNACISGLTLCFLLNEQFLAGMQAIAVLPAASALLAFVWLVLLLKGWAVLCWQYLAPGRCRHAGRDAYREMEDQVTLEEYEAQTLQYDKRQFGNYATLMRALARRQRRALSETLLSLQKSDSLDQLAERIAGSDCETSEGDSRPRALSTVIDPLTLRLKDATKELGYRTCAPAAAAAARHSRLIVTNLAVCSVLGGLKAVELFLMDMRGADVAWPSAMSSEIVSILASLAALYRCQRVAPSRGRRVVWALILAVNAGLTAYFLVDPPNPMAQVLLLYTIAFTLSIGQQALVLASCTSFLAAAGFVRLRTALIWAEGRGEEEKLQIVRQVYAVVYFVLLWTLLAYVEELSRKVAYARDCGIQKELQRLKGLLNQLLPRTAGGAERGPERFTPVCESGVTVVHIELAGYERLARECQGKRLLEVQDRLYRGFGALAARHGLLPLEAWSGRYLACAGLRSNASEAASRPPGGNPCSRVLRFAEDIHRFMETQSSIQHWALRAKTAIATGDVVHGPVGDLKQKYTLLGPAVDEAVQLTQFCRPGSIVTGASKRALIAGRTDAHRWVRRASRARGFDGKNVVYYELGRGDPQADAQSEDRKAQAGKRSQAGATEAAENPEDRQLASGPSAAESDVRVRAEGEPRYPLPTEPPGQSHDEDDLDVEGPARSDDLDPGWKGQDPKQEAFIMQSDALRGQYKLVARTRFLLGIGFNVREQSLFLEQLHRHAHLEVLLMVAKFLLDLALAESISCQYLSGRQPAIRALLPPGILAVHLACALAVYRCRGRVGIRAYSVLVCLSFLVSMLAFLRAGPSLRSPVVQETQALTLCLYQTIPLLSRSCPFRAFVAVQGLIIVAALIANYHFLGEGPAPWLEYARHVAAALVYTAFLLLIARAREGVVRERYNRGRILRVESEKTRALLRRLVPAHALAGISVGQIESDTLPNCTLLHISVEGLQFAGRPGAARALGELHKLFCKFDALCDGMGAHKVCSRGAAYTVLGYGGQAADERGQCPYAIGEASRVVRIGLEALEVLKRAQASHESNHTLQRMRLRVGIHSGTVHGRVVGSGIVHYDVAGPDVGVTAEVAAASPPGRCTVSQATVALLQQRKAIAERLAVEACGELRKQRRSEQTPTQPVAGLPLYTVSHYQLASMPGAGPNHQQLRFAEPSPRSGSADEDGEDRGAPEEGEGSGEEEGTEDEGYGDIGVYEGEAEGAE